jgi:hypothetical protein
MKSSWPLNAAVCRTVRPSCGGVGNNGGWVGWLGARAGVGGEIACGCGVGSRVLEGRELVNARGALGDKAAQSRGRRAARGSEKGGEGGHQLEGGGGRRRSVSLAWASRVRGGGWELVGAVVRGHLAQ